MWLSGGLGLALAVLYGAVSLLTNRKALRMESQQQFLAVFIGGMLARLAGVLLLLLIGLLILPLENAIFAVAFLIGFIPVLAFEVFHINRQVNGQSGEASA